MNSEKIIRINKVLREYNISLERAVAIFKSVNIDIESNPNAKINEEQYQFLVSTLEMKKYETVIPPQITNHIVIDSIRKAKGIPSTVFKYFGTKEIHLESLKEKYLYHSDYVYFNDPFDCNIELINFEKTGKSKKEDKLEDDIRNKFSSIGVCCFTRNVNSILMWSHYASNHKGFCVEYNYNSRINGINPLDVNYSNSFVKADFYKDKQDALFHMVFTKAKQWEYEEELRSINSHFTDNNSRKVPFLKEDIRAIYMGVNCYESTRVEIVEIANLVFNGKITLFQGELSDSNFEIVWKEMK
jgi:hypothetical protein